jgi:hypothetical protein
MNRLLKASYALLCLAGPAVAQGIRYDQRITTVLNNVPSGASAPVYATSEANIKVCTTASSYHHDHGSRNPIAHS